MASVVLIDFGPMDGVPTYQGSKNTLKIKKIKIHDFGAGKNILLFGISKLILVSQKQVTE